METSAVCHLFSTCHAIAKYGNAVVLPDIKQYPAAREQHHQASRRYGGTRPYGRTRERLRPETDHAHPEPLHFSGQIAIAEQSLPTAYRANLGKFRVLRTTFFGWRLEQMVIRLVPGASNRWCYDPIATASPDSSYPG